MDRLKKQLTTEYKKDAEDCIKIYNKLKESSGGKVWESQWNPLVNIKWLGKYPYQAKYKPTANGYIFLKGIEENQAKIYTKEEVKKLCKEAWRVGFNTGQNDEDSPSYQTAEDWLKDNI